jgi:hypothetical protein
MDTQPKINEPRPAPPLRKRVGRLRVVLAVLVVLSLAATALIFFQPAESEMTWLTPAAVQQAAKPGALKAAWYRFRWMIGSLNRFLPASKKAQLLFSAKIYLFINSPFDLDVPAAATNADGSRAWIIPSSSLQSLDARLKLLPPSALLSNPRTQVSDGIRSQMSVGSTMIVDGKIVPVGLTMDLFPKISKNAVSIVVSVVDSQNDASSIKTNFAVACAATVPDSGALVIDAGGTGGNHYWLVLSPVLVDATGKPIKH